jgi:uncharacterized protein YhbP (UPF0306 family)
MSSDLATLGPADLDGVVGFLEQHRVIHLATSGPEGSHSAPLFYALVEPGLELTWISDPETRHSRQLAGLAEVGASVSGSAPSPISVEGVQFRGTVDSREEDQARLCAAYLQRFPAARALLAASARHRFYRLRPHWVRWIRWSAGIKRNLEGAVPIP